MKHSELQKVLDTLIEITNDRVDEIPESLNNFTREDYIRLFNRNLMEISSKLRVTNVGRSSEVLVYEKEGANLTVGFVKFKTKQRKGVTHIPGRYGGIYPSYYHSYGVSATIDPYDDSIEERWEKIKEYYDGKEKQRNKNKQDAENARKLLEENGFNVNNIKQYL